MKDHITLDSILAEIEQVRELALSVDDYKTALNCTMSKANLLGCGGALEARQQKRENPSPLDKLLEMSI